MSFSPPPLTSSSVATMIRRPLLSIMFATSLRRIASVSSRTTCIAGGARRGFSILSITSSLQLRGGGELRSSTTTTSFRDNSSSSAETKYTTLDTPAPGSPFHYAFPVHSVRRVCYLHIHTYNMYKHFFLVSFSWMLQRTSMGMCWVVLKEDPPRNGKTIL